MKTYDVIIIGAGAAGMAGAIAAKQENPKLKLAVLEKMDRPGLKVAASGNGRCNITNTSCPDYLGTMKFFQSIGIMTRDDGRGWIYPYNEEAKSVVSVLKETMKKQGTELFCGKRVTAVSHIDYEETSKVRGDKDGMFEILVEGEEESYKAKRILLSTGGKSGPKLGTTGDGFILARNLGHMIRTLVPSLTTIETHEDVRYLSGVRAKARVTLYFEGIPVAAEDGEVQFTEKGISGICVYNLTRYMTELPLDSYGVRIDFLPDVWNIEELLIDRENLMGKEDMLLTMVKRPLRKLIEDEAGGDLHVMANLVKEFPLSVKNLGGWRQAQVTRGGVDLSQVSHETQESTIVKGLFIAGEVLDYDGPCGGFNLNNAWQTGIKAGRAMATL